MKYSKKYYRLVSRWRRRWVTVVIRHVRCGICYACRSNRWLPCAYPRTLRLRRKITGGDFFANRRDNLPF